MIRGEKKGQRLFLKGEVEGKLQQKQGIGVQVKELSNFFSLSWLQGRKRRHPSRYCEENMWSVSSIPGVKEVSRKAGLKVAFKLCFFKLLWSSIIEILASPPAPLSFTQNLMVISFLTEMCKGIFCYKYMF